jgi:hypothetical protein
MPSTRTADLTDSIRLCLAVVLVAFPPFYAVLSFVAPPNAPPWLLVVPLLATVPTAVWCRRRGVPRSLLWSLLLTVHGLAIPLLVAVVLVSDVVDGPLWASLPSDVLLLLVVGGLYGVAWAIVSRDFDLAHC